MSLPHANLFAQMLDFVPRESFECLVRQHGAERAAKGFASWDQFVAMLFCHFGQAQTLREIEMGLASASGKLKHLGLQDSPSRSTLAYANEHRPAALFADVFQLVLDQARPWVRGRNVLRLRHKVLLLDATVIDLCLDVFDWAHFRRAKGAVKLHLLLDREGCLPVFAHITPGKVHEVKVAQGLQLPSGAIVVMDRAYNDYKLFNDWCDRGVYFVTRMKQNAVFEVLEQLPVAPGSSVRRDDLILLSGTRADKLCPHILRRIVLWDEKQQRELVFLTNIVHLSARTVARLYKERWKIELFFKALKQNLRVKSFVGTSANALTTQIWTALIAMLILRIMQLRAGYNWSFSNLVAVLHWNLFTYRNLWAWLNAPWQTPALSPPAQQLELPFQSTV